MNIKESFERVGFTSEEKLDLTARLERAAEEENMTDATKRNIKRISGTTVFGIAAAAVMTVGTLAAVLNPGLRSWFDTTTPGASEVLESGIYHLNRSETYNGWTVTLDECVGDDNNMYIWVDLIAPEGTVLVPPENGYIWSDFWIGYGGRNLEAVPDEDPTDNKISYILATSFQWDKLRGQTVTIRLTPFREQQWVDAEYGQELQDCNILTEAIKDHEWVFEDVTLDFPDQTIRLDTNVEVPWIDSTATVTRLEVSPLSVLVELEGSACADYLAFRSTDRFAYDDAVVEDKIVTPDGTTITFGAPSGYYHDKLSEMENSLTVETVLKDGTTLASQSFVGMEDGTREGVDGPETSYVSWSRRYSIYGNGPASFVDPAQVDHVTVCGVDISLDPADPAPIIQPSVPDSAGTSEEAAPTVGTVTAGKGLNVRSGPGTQYKVVGGLKKDTQVTILGEENGFYKISYGDNKTGYASKAHVFVE